MLDRQLAELLVQIGLDRNADVDTIASELTSLRLPTFVDADAFRTSLIDAIEVQLRKQTDDRIRRLRESLGNPPVPAPAGQSGKVNVTHEPAPDDTAIPVPPQPEPYQTIVEPVELPSDATMVWKSRE